MGNFVSNDNATSLVTKVGQRLELRPKTWTGTHNDWNAMSAADQAKYEYVNFTDDYVDPSNLGTAAEKDYTTSITQGGTDLPTAGAVYTYIDTTITQALTASY